MKAESLTSLMIILLCLNNVLPGGWKAKDTWTNRKVQEVDTVGRNNWETEWKDEYDYTNARILRQLEHGRWEEKPDITSAKLSNKMKRSINGNIHQNIKIIHWNIGSKLWGNKMIEIECLLQEQKPQLCFISEANIWGNVELDDCQIMGYNLVLPSTMEHLGYARIALLVRDDFEVEIMRENMDKEISTIWVKIGTTRKNSYIVGGIYRELQILGQDNNAATWLEKKAEQERRWRKILKQWKAAGNNRKCTVIGDINLDQLRWQDADQLNEQMVEMTQNSIETIGYCQLVQQHTRRWRHQQDSLLDHIWTNSGQRILSHFNTQRGDSDHNVVGLTLSGKDIHSGGQNVVKRLWGGFDPVRFLGKLRREDWTSILRETNIDLANSEFEDKYLAILETEAPMRTVQMRVKYNCWLTDVTKMEMSLRDIARDIAKLSDKDEDWSSYRKKRNLCTKMQREDRSRYYRKMYEQLEGENDAAQIHATTRKLLGYKRSGPPTCFLQDGVPIRKQNDLAEMQAVFYQEKVNGIKSSLPGVCRDPLEFIRRAYDKWLPSGGMPQFDLKEVTDSDVVKMLKDCKNSKAFGRDNIDAHTLKLAAPVLAPILRHIINLSLGTGRFPQKWKIARTIPLLKSPDLDRLKPGSYRPVALLPILSKLTERSIQSQLLKYLEQSGLLHTQQHAYRQRSSTTTALIELMDNIATGTDENLITATMSLDQSSAFDCVDHSILKSKLGYYGLGRRTVKWIDSYLSSRSSYVVIGSGRSGIKSMTHGVPQGSVMGPLMYLLYINELPLVIEDKDCKDTGHRNTEKLFNSNCTRCGLLPVFADDIQYQYQSNSRDANQDKIDENFVRIRDFLQSHGLQINEMKTGLTEFMTKQKRARTRGIPPDLTVTKTIKDKRTGQSRTEDDLVNDSRICRTLGMNLQNNLAWEAHLVKGKKAVLPAARKILGSLYRLKDKVSQRIKLQLTNSLVISKISYGICLWGNTTTNYVRKAQILLNQSGRFVTGKGRTTRQTEIMSECGWMNCRQMTEYHTLLQIFKTVRWGTPAYIRSKIEICEEEKLSTNAPRLQLTANSYRMKAVQYWNEMPMTMRSEVRISHFKKSVKRWILERHPQDPGQRTQDLMDT